MFDNKAQREKHRNRELRKHHEWARRKWENAFTEDWDYEYFLIYMRAKLETMERYNNQLSYAMNGPYYGHQIGRAIKMIDIIPESFKHYVNMKNRRRIPDNDNGLSFWSDAQKLRFDKAWMLLWKILSERLMSWGD